MKLWHFPTRGVLVGRELWNLSKIPSFLPPVARTDNQDQLDASARALEMANWATFAPITPGEITIQRIRKNAERDKIDIKLFPYCREAMLNIATLWRTRKKSQMPAFDNPTRIDTHTHPVPPWFRKLQTLSAGRETPSWDPISHLQFMAQHNIAHSIICPSTPQANAFPGDRNRTVALARLLNEFSYELAKIYPERFSWMAVTPLPYVEDALVEARYALEELGAAGVGILTNHEGLYPGEERFDPLWAYLQKRAEEGDGKEIVFIHPHDPMLRLQDGPLVSSKPCKPLISH